ncbi:MAG: hypothetical protein AAGA68_13355 [Pseudomonadota bacterium]
MDGFLPLIEAFLAFALTMLGLATAVAALTGIWQRAFRWRAAILRESLVTLYTSKIAPLLGGGSDSATRENALAEFIVEMTMLPVAYHEALPRAQDEVSPASTSGANDTQLRPPLDAQTGLRARRIDRVQRCLGVPRSRFLLIRQFFRLQRAWRGWLASRYAVESLPEPQFARRFADSTIGRAVAHTIGPGRWDAFVEDLTDSYSAIGVGATEEFTRRCRVYTVATSFALVFGVNVDAFDLLNRYLTDSDVRASVLDQEETLLANATVNPAADTDGARQARKPPAAQRMQSVIQSLREVAPTEDARKLVDELEGLRGEAAQEFSRASDASRRVASELVDNFPIGWNRYPYCDDGYLTDPRCLRVVANAARRTSTLADAEPVNRVDPATNAPSSQWQVFRTVVGRTWRVDAGGMVKWFLGVILAGLMAGLGAPFWVRVVNRALEVRSVVRSRGSDADRTKASAETRGEPAAPTPPRPADLVLGTAAGVDLADAAAIARQAADEALGKATRDARAGSR